MLTALRATPPIVLAAALLAIPALAPRRATEPECAHAHHRHAWHQHAWEHHPWVIHSFQFERSARIDATMVHRPELLADGRPWPQGMVIEPPETHDRILGGFGDPDDLVSTLIVPLAGALFESPATLL